MLKIDETLPVGARIIILMSDGGEWTVKKLRQPLGLTTIQVRRAIRTLAINGIVSVTRCLIASHENVYKLAGIETTGDAAALAEMARPVVTTE
ncbi:hypothetical protein [Burkholderia sp. Z1]|uniref:hypothetical protein n=1 Tax=Burkholderia sp. Z1 TaxID=2759039 RepID=UPI001865EAA8|nr:hypothetical protein [Burkholderia sp. Z1]